MLKSLKIVGLLILLNTQFIQSQNDWENELMFEQNKMRSRVPSYSYLNHKEALIGNRKASRIQSLNGVWKFNFVEKSENRPLDLRTGNYKVMDNLFILI